MATIFVDMYATGDNDGSSWEDAYSDLQAAIDAAAPGDSIWVKWGLYDSPAENGFYISTNNVSIYGGFDSSLGGTDGDVVERVTKTVINGNDIRRCFTVGLSSSGTGCIDGFAIINGYTGDGGGINIYNNGE